MGENIFNFGSAQVYAKDSEGNEINIGTVGSIEGLKEDVTEKYVDFLEGCSGTFKLKMSGEQKRKIKAYTKAYVKCFELANIFNRTKKFRIKKKLFARIIEIETGRK